MEVNKIYNEDCIATMSHNIDLGSVDIILTSPPYNTCRSNGSLKTYASRYEEYSDTMSNDEYISWTLRLFDSFDKILKPNGVVLYNISYGSENNETLWRLIAEVISSTNFTVADCIIWKKRNALVNNTSPQHLTRICEFVFVFCRKSEYNSYTTNKPISSVGSNGQVMYGNVTNFIEAANNDGSVDFHKATYSTELCRKLLQIYGKGGMLVYDPFIGTGTTALACIEENMNFIGSEISQKYTDYANKRISNKLSQPKLF